jgi:nicotine blue oxidoreductase
LAVSGPAAGGSAVGGSASGGSAVAGSAVAGSAAGGLAVGGLAARGSTVGGLAVGGSTVGGGSGVVAGLLLAAGAGRRYGMPKALVVDGGRLLVERALATLREGGCAPVVVVLGAAADEVLARADLSGATPVVNEDWASGMGSSLRAGLAALRSSGSVGRSGSAGPSGLVGGPGLRGGSGAGPEAGAVDAVCVLLVDTPGITPAAVRRVASRGGPGALVVATYDGEQGHPVLLGRDHWDAVAAMAVGDVGARRYLTRHPDLVTRVPCEDIATGDDLDAPADASGGGAAGHG